MKLRIASGLLRHPPGTRPLPPTPATWLPCTGSASTRSGGASPNKKPLAACDASSSPNGSPPSPQPHRPRTGRRSARIAHTATRLDDVPPPASDQLPTAGRRPRSRNLRHRLAHPPRSAQQHSDLMSERGLDHDGTTAREGTLDRVPAAFAPVVNAARVHITETFGNARLHSAYPTACTAVHGEKTPRPRKAPFQGIGQVNPHKFRRGSRPHPRESPASVSRRRRHHKQRTLAVFLIVALVVFLWCHALRPTRPSRRPHFRDQPTVRPAPARLHRAGRLPLGGVSRGPGPLGGPRAPSPAQRMVIDPVTGLVNMTLGESRSARRRRDSYEDPRPSADRRDRFGQHQRHGGRPCPGRSADLCRTRPGQPVGQGEFVEHIGPELVCRHGYLRRSNTP